MNSILLFPPSPIPLSYLACTVSGREAAQISGPVLLTHRIKQLLTQLGELHTAYNNQQNPRKKTLAVFHSTFSKRSNQ